MIDPVNEAATRPDSGRTVEEPDECSKIEKADAFQT